MSAIIGTWKMSFIGVQQSTMHLANSGTAEDAVEQAIMYVEDNPASSSVGYGGLKSLIVIEV